MNTDRKVCTVCGAATAEKEHVCTPASTVNEASVPTIRVGSSGTRQAPGPAKAGPKPDPTTAGRRKADVPPSNLDELQKVPQKVVNQYVLCEVLGQGGMGQVWKAWDTKLARWTALKFLTVSDESSLKRFEREAKLAARLRHPNIAAVYEVGEEQGRHFIAMEYVDGVSLGKAGLDVRQAAEVIAKIARALEEAHREGVVHRDLKPDNLMISSAGRPYVMDFGLAKTVEAESSLSVTGDVMGTPAFMSPEQARGEVEILDGRTDVYSLGATLYALLTGEKPFSGRTSMEIVLKVVNQDPVPPRKLNSKIPAPLEAVVLKAMEKDRERRYPTAAQFAMDLERFLGNQEVEARPPSFAGLVVRRARRNALPLVLLAGMVASASVGIYAWTRQQEHSLQQPPPPADTEWLTAFRNDRRGLEYREWNPDDTELPGRIHTHLARLESLPPEDTREASDWLRKEIELSENALELWSGQPRAVWMKLRDQAARARAWCDAALSSIDGLGGDFAALSPRLAEVRRGAEALARWQGEFTLRVAAVPFGKVTRLKRAGQDVSLKDRETPLVIGELEIDDYEIEVSSGTLAGRLSIPAARLRDGVTTTLVGDLRREGSLRILP